MSKLDDIIDTIDALRRQGERALGDMDHASEQAGDRDRVSASANGRGHITAVHIDSGFLDEHSMQTLSDELTQTLIEASLAGQDSGAEILVGVDDDGI